MLLTPPSAERFAEFPASWYLFGTLRELRRGPVAKELLGRRLVAFQTSSGEVALLDGRCSHLGADLARGCLVGDTLQCPYHGWRYNAQGECVEGSQGKLAPAFARQRRYPVTVRHGFVFFFNGDVPLFPLPFFHDADPDQFVAGRLFGSTGDCPWYLLAANAFDTAHFQLVHDRTLAAPPFVTQPAPFGRRIHLSWRVTGDALADRFLRAFVGDHPEVTITCWGGTLTLVTARFRRAESFLLVASRPVEPHRTHVEVIVYAPRGKHPLHRLALPAMLEVRRWLTRAFLQDDFDRLAGIRYSPHTLTAADQSMIDYFRWLADLPQTAAQAAEFSDSFSDSDTMQELPCSQAQPRVV